MQSSNFVYLIDYTNVVFQYEACLDRLLSSPTLTNPLEIEFVKRGLEWSLRALDRFTHFGISS